MGGDKDFDEFSFFFLIGGDADFDNKKCNKKNNPVTLAQIETYIHIYLRKK